MVVLAVLVLAVLIFQADPSEVAGLFREADLHLLALVVGLYLLNFSTKILRWWALLTSKGHSVPLGRIALYFLIGMTISNSTPGHVSGEPVRAYLVKKGTDYPMGRGMASIFLEKTIDTIVTLSLAVIGILLLIRVLQPEASTALLLSAGIVALLMGGLIVLVAFPSGPRRISGWIFRRMRARADSERVERLEAMVDGFLGTFEQGTRDIARDRPRAMAATGLTVVIWLNDALRLWLLFLALDFNISAELSMVAVTLASFAALLIPLGAGNSAAIAAICILAGVDATLSTSVGLLFIMTSTWICVLMGVAAMAVTGVRAKDLLGASRKEEGLGGGGRVELDPGPEGDPESLDVPDEEGVPGVPDPPGTDQQDKG